MSEGCVISILKPCLESLGIILSSSQIEQMQHLLDVMLADPLYPSVSKIFAPEEIVTKHFLDSLAPLCFNLPLWKSQRVLDLGTGGGFPCLPLAIALPESQFCAVDARQKSVDFVARMASAVGLKNVSVKHARIEDIGREKDFREKADLVVCRALSAVRTLVEYTLPLVKSGGWTFFYKGPRLDGELADSAGAFSAFFIAPADVELLHLTPPELPFERSFVAIKKLRPVPEKFPRKSGLPTSNPL